MSRRPRLLLVSYFYPPTRDTGARRPAAMAKWLERLGWDVTVLTTRAFGGTDGGGVVRAADLQTLRRAGTVRSLFDADTYAGRPHPLSKLIVPEPLAVAWMPFARRAALREHRREPFDAALTTSPPESAHAVGLALKRRGVRWVADVRDAWTFEPLRPEFPTGAQRRLDERLERRWLGAADAVVCVSEPAAADLRERGIADPVVIRNAWDPDDEPAETSGGDPFDPERMTLFYTGRFGSYGRDPRALADALGRLGAEEASSLELAIAGPLKPEERALFEAIPGPANVTLLGSLEPARTLELQRRADALLLLAQPARSQLLNSKLFEYLAAGRPILALCAGTEAGRAATEAGIEPVVRADDPEAIASALAATARGELRGPDAGSAERNAYPAAAERMSAVLRDGDRVAD